MSDVERRPIGRFEDFVEEGPRRMTDYSARPTGDRPEGREVRSGRPRLEGSRERTRRARSNASGERSRGPRPNGSRSGRPGDLDMRERRSVNSRNAEGQRPSRNARMPESSFGDRKLSGQGPNGSRGGRSGGSGKPRVGYFARKMDFYKKPKNRNFFISRAIIPLSFFWYEMIFNLGTVHDFWGMHFIFILCFSILYGMVFGIFASFAQNRTVNMILKAIFLFLPVIPFLVEYFVYRQFKVFYDLNTILNGAADAAGGFKKDIKLLVVSFNGISHIILFLLPLVLFLLWELKFDKKKIFSSKTGWKRKLKMLRTAGIAYLVAIFFILISSIYRPAYTTQYNYQTFVTDFGFMTGFRKEVVRKITGANAKVSFAGKTELGSDSYDPTNGTEEPAVETEEVIATGTDAFKARSSNPSDYGYNKLDIDFSQLAESDSGTYAQIDEYVASLTPSHKNKYTGMFRGKNLIFITAEAFSGDVIDENLTPTLYRMANKGIQINDYIQPASAGTTGGEFSNIFGILPVQGGSSMTMTETYNNYWTMGSQLDRLGYWGKMYHNNDYTYYGRHETHIHLGYSEGFEGYGNGMENYVENVWPQSDTEMFDGTFAEYCDKQPFNVYYMSVSGHSLYSQAENAMSRKHWDQVKDLNYSDTVKAYIAANLELEEALTHLIDNLEKKGIADDTVIVLGADHFPYGLDSDASLGNMPYLSELYGKEVNDYLTRDHNRLLIWSKCLEDSDPIVVDTPVNAIDILPTLSNLFGTEFDSRLMPGRDIFSDAQPLSFNLNYDWKTEKGTYISGTGTFTPVDSTVKVSNTYVDNVNSIVANKINYFSGLLNNDYWGHLAELGLYPSTSKLYEKDANQTPTDATPYDDSKDGLGIETEDAKKLKQEQQPK